MTDDKSVTSTSEKKTVRRRKVESEPVTPVKPVSSILGSFSDLLGKIEEERKEFEKLQKEISEARALWEREQREHLIKIAERDRNAEIERKREEETYRYEFSLRVRKSEDEFGEKINKWEKELAERKDEIARDKEELQVLRKQVADFDVIKEKTVKEATTALQKELISDHVMENKMREQEVKAEKGLLSLRIESLAQEKAKLEKEVVALKTSLETATRELKDIAVKVIESNKPISPQSKPE